MDRSCDQPRHRLALVIGSGGIRSAAAIGVVDALQSAGLRPDLIVGCSSGALFGSVLAMGLSPAHVLRMARAMWTQDLTEQRRWKAYLQLLMPKLGGFDADFSFRGAERIERTVRNAFEDRLIEDLPTAMRIAATDAASGARVLLNRGPLTTAVLASMAVPFVFPSVDFEGRRLVDGVMSDPMPLAAASDAQVVVSLAFTGALPRRVDRVSRLAAQVSTTMINNLQDARMAAAMEVARAQGRRIVSVDLMLNRRVGLWETAAIPEVFEAGRRAAFERLADISAAVALAPLRNAA